MEKSFKVCNSYNEIICKNCIYGKPVDYVTNKDDTYCLYHLASNGPISVRATDWCPSGVWVIDNSKYPCDKYNQKFKNYCDAVQELKFDIHDINL